MPQALQNVAVEIEQIAAAAEKPFEVGHPAEDRLIEQFNSHHVPVLFPFSAQKPNVLHIRFEQGLAVGRIGMGLVKARGIIVHLADPYQSAKAPGQVIVVEADAPIPHVHAGRVALVGAHCIIGPGIVAIGSDRFDLTAATTKPPRTHGGEGMIGTGYVGWVVEAAAMSTGALRSGRFLHVGPGPPGQTLSAVGGGEGVIVEFQEDINPVLFEGLGGKPKPKPSRSGRA